MIKIASLLLLSVLSGFSHAGEPKETLGAFHAALAVGDKIKAVALLAPDVAIHESGHVERSRAEYASRHLADDIGFAKTTTRAVLRQSERIDGKVAVIWSETETKGSYGGKDILMSGLETAVLEKKDGSWNIVHLHWSARNAK